MAVISFLKDFGILNIYFETKNIVHTFNYILSSNLTL